MNPRHNPTFLLVVSYSLRRLPYIVRAAYAGYQQTSITLEEASYNLGAGRWRTFSKITLPLIAPSLIAGTILTFCFAMLEVSDSLILAVEVRFAPITRGIYEVMGRPSPDSAALACALGVLAMGILGGGLLLGSRLMGQRLGTFFPRMKLFPLWRVRLRPDPFVCFALLSGSIFLLHAQTNTPPGFPTNTANFPVVTGKVSTAPVIGPSRHDFRGCRCSACRRATCLHARRPLQRPAHQEGPGAP